MWCAVQKCCHTKAAWNSGSVAAEGRHFKRVISRLWHFHDARLEIIAAANAGAGCVFSVGWSGCGAVRLEVTTKLAVADNLVFR